MCVSECMGVQPWTSVHKFSSVTHIGEYVYSSIWARIFCIKYICMYTRISRCTCRYSCIYIYVCTFKKKIGVFVLKNMGMYNLIRVDVYMGICNYVFKCCVYVCIYVCICAYKRIYMYTRICVGLWVCVYVCTYVNVNTSAGTYMHAYVDTWFLTNLCEHIKHINISLCMG